MSKLIALRLPDDLAARLETRCSIRGQSKTDVLIEAIQRGWDGAGAAGATTEPIPTRAAIKSLNIPGVFMGSQLGMPVTNEHEPVEPEEDNRPCCRECDKPMTAKMYKGTAIAWACGDLACPMYGLERKR